MNLPGKQKGTDLVVSTIGIFILLLFNEKSQMTVQTICDALQIDEVTCRKNLACLCQKQYKVLELEKKLQSQLQDVEMIDSNMSQASVAGCGDKVTLNTKFQSNYIRLSLPIPVLEEVFKKEKITEDRHLAIDACVVRIMKTRKRVDISTLLSDVLSGLHMFKPQPAQIKKRIEHLIEKDFMRRDEQEKNLLHYIA